MRRDVQDDKPDLTQWMPDNVPYKESFWYRLGMAAQRGAQKYGRRNYQHANSQEELERFKASAFRHMQQWYYGEEDEDHAVAVVFNLMCAEMVKYKLKQASTEGHEVLPVFTCLNCKGVSRGPLCVPCQSHIDKLTREMSYS